MSIPFHTIKDVAQVLRSIAKPGKTRDQYCFCRVFWDKDEIYESTHQVTSACEDLRRFVEAVDRELNG